MSIDLDLMFVKNLGKNSVEQNVEWADSVSGDNFDSTTMLRSIKAIHIPEGIANVASGCFSGKTNLETIVLPESLTRGVGDGAFYGCTSLKTVIFKSTPNSIGEQSFGNCTCNIYVPWSEGEVANAPWGATNATIHYNSVL